MSILLGWRIDKCHQLNFFFEVFSMHIFKDAF